MNFTRRYSTVQPPVSERNRPYVQALRRLSARTGTPLPSLILSFGILHELTAIIPLIGVFFGARALGAGDKTVELLPTEWVQEGEEWAGRVGRRYGVFGFDKKGKEKDSAVETKVAIGDVANVVLAYAVVKAILPLRIGLSLWLAPGFSRRVFDPIRFSFSSPIITFFDPPPAAFGRSLAGYSDSTRLGSVPRSVPTSTNTTIDYPRVRAGAMSSYPTLQTLPASVLLLLAQLLAPPLLKHTFRPPGYRESHRSLLAASSTCHALRRTCFPLAIRIFRNHEPKPLNRADIGESTRELEKRIEWVLGRNDLWGYIRMIDFELFARGSNSLGHNLATLISSLPNLESLAIRLPAFRVFRDSLTSDLQSAFSNRSPIGNVATLSIDTYSAWMVPWFPGAKVLVVWSRPNPGICEDDDRTSGWKMFLGSLSAQAPRVVELEIGGLSIWDVNEMFPALANLLGNIEVLRILHRSEPYGSIPGPSSFPRILPLTPLSPTTRTARLPSAIQSSIQFLWEDSQLYPEYEGQYISGYPGAVKHIVYFGLQDECGSCYVPINGDGPGWMDVGPAVVLGSEDMKDHS
ncbi:unnamed protein product [Rhizoctonia solani]|uniref:Uncharacterized protein n=1 Tax=Rhizoctonia solani TaxID=456999 RepID=A0A8H2WEE0_9AGAM|nr:unnamed protein product [Rhizoctonia solani]